MAYRSSLPLIKASLSFSVRSIISSQCGASGDGSWECGIKKRAKAAPIS